MAEPRGVVAVTGATGFIGRKVVEMLAAQGWRVRVLARRPTAAGVWGEARPELVAGDLSDPDALGVLAAGADVMIHSAGLVKARSRAEFMAVNAHGARAAAQAYAARGTGRRFVLISSLAAREPQLSDYAASKRAGEAAAIAELPASALSIVRPPAIYGPGDRETLDVFRAASRLPFAPRLGGPDARLALAHVDDAAAEIVRLAQRPSAWPLSALGGDRPEGYGWREILQAAGAAVGRTPPTVRLPAALVKTAGALASLASRVDGRPRMLSPGKAHELLHPDWSVAAAELGPERVAARFTLPAGFAQTAAWYRAQGWLPRSGHSL